MSPTHDVVVIGPGGTGSATAHHLSERGARVLGLEKFGPVHQRGSSHGGSRITRQSHFEDPAYVPLLLRAYELYDGPGAGHRPGDRPAVRGRDGRPPRLADRVRLAALGPAVGPAARGAGRRGDPPPLPDPGAAGRRGRAARGEGRSPAPREHGRLPPPARHPAGRRPALRRTRDPLGAVPGRGARAHRREHVHRGPAGGLPRRLGAAAAARPGDAVHRRTAAATPRTPTRSPRPAGSPGTASSSCPSSGRSSPTRP
ncbi:Monomeric sarcosine oxidase [Streptomyces sp. enrichment culture]